MNDNGGIEIIEREREREDELCEEGGRSCMGLHICHVSLSVSSTRAMDVLSSKTIPSKQQTLHYHPRAP